MGTEKSTEEKLAEAEKEIEGLEAEMDDHVCFCDCDEPDGGESPREAVATWLERQKLFGISPEGKATVERLIEDLS